MGAWSSGAGPAQLGPAVVTAVEGVSFCISDRSGDIRPGSGQGLFHQDTRFINAWNLTVDGRPVSPLAVHRPGPYAAIFVGQGPSAPGVADSTLLVVRERYVSGGMVERITVVNLSNRIARVQIGLAIDADFAGLFEVKEGRGRRRRAVRRSVDQATVRLATAGTNGRRAVVITDGDGGVAADDRLLWHLTIAARGEAVIRVQVRPEVDDVPAPGRLALDGPIAEHAAADLTAWRRRLPRMRTSNAVVRSLFCTSLEDLGALRIPDGHRPPRTVVAAGAPWFMTLFGRDSLLTSWMLLPIDRSIAAGTLRVLADLQGRNVDTVTEEEPGRILHEVRSGLDARAALGGGTVYYGSIDATPLFVMLLDQAHRWGMPDGEVQDLIGHADRAIDWIQRYGDRDSDGYVEYQRATDRGLVNQGWKDSFDAISGADGTLAEPPIALAEVQGYVYAAYRARARLAAHFEDSATAADLAARAADLRGRFNRDFWLPDQGFYALALDRDKRPVEALASNMAHCLWTGIVDRDKAPLVADHLTSPAMFSGFGVRTLAATMGAYNPVSYHNGSVWPHDTAIAVAGLMRYGLVQHAQRIALGLIDAAARLGGRLPELLCGFDRSQFADPIPYPTSCSPQAWAAAAPLLMLRSLLRFEPDLPQHTITCQPALPAELTPMRISGVAVGLDAVSLTVRRRDWRLDGVADGVRLDRPTPE